MVIECNLPPEHRWLAKKKATWGISPIIKFPLLNPTSTLTFGIMKLQGRGKDGVAINQIVLSNEAPFLSTMDFCINEAQLKIANPDWDYSHTGTPSDTLVKTFQKLVNDIVFRNNDYNETFYVFLYKEVYYVIYHVKSMVVFVARLNSKEMNSLMGFFQSYLWGKEGMREPFWKLIIAFPNTLFYTNLKINEEGVSNELWYEENGTIFFEWEGLKTSTGFGNPMLFSMKEMLSPHPRLNIVNVQKCFVIQPNNGITPLVLLPKFRGYYSTVEAIKNIDLMFAPMSQGIRYVKGADLCQYLIDRLPLWLNAPLPQLVVEIGNWADSVQYQMLPTLANDKGFFGTTDMDTFKKYLIGKVTKEDVKLVWVDFESTRLDDPNLQQTKANFLELHKTEYVIGKKSDYYVPLYQVLNRKVVTNQQWESLQLEVV